MVFSAPVSFTVSQQSVLLVKDMTCQFLCMLGHTELWCSCGWQEMGKSHLLIISCQFYWVYLSLKTAPPNLTLAPLTHQYLITWTDMHVHTQTHTRVLFHFIEDWEGSKGFWKPEAQLSEPFEISSFTACTCLSMPRWRSWTTCYTWTDITPAIKVTVL